MKENTESQPLDLTTDKKELKFSSEESSLMAIFLKSFRDVEVGLTLTETFTLRINDSETLNILDSLTERFRQRNKKMANLKKQSYLDLRQRTLEKAMAIFKLEDMEDYINQHQSDQETYHMLYFVAAEGRVIRQLFERLEVLGELAWEADRDFIADAIKGKQDQIRQKKKEPEQKTDSPKNAKEQQQKEMVALIKEVLDKYNQQNLGIKIGPASIARNLYPHLRASFIDNLVEKDHIKPTYEGHKQFYSATDVIIAEYLHRNRNSPSWIVADLKRLAEPEVKKFFKEKSS
jgi:hypothetical protein